MATIRTAIQMYDGMSPALRSITNALNIAISSFETMQATSSNAIDVRELQAARTEISNASAALKSVEDNIERAKNSQDKLNHSIRDTTLGAKSLSLAVMGVNAAIELGQKAWNMISGVMTKADEYKSINARLNLVNDGLMNQLELQKAIRSAAKDTRSSYLATSDVVAKLGLVARNVFPSNAELIDFTILVNKALKIGGGGAAQNDAALLQLSQALGSGRLQGDEFKSLMENAPMLMQSIADGMKVPIGALKQMAADGELTAQVIKDALMSQADVIDERFKQMPVTFGETMTGLKDIFFGWLTSLTAAGQPLDIINQKLQKLNIWLSSPSGNVFFNNLAIGIGAAVNAVSWLLDLVIGVGSVIVDNWSIIEPIIMGIVFAFGLYNAILLINKGIMIATSIAHGIAATATAIHAAFTSGWTIATFKATAAQQGLNAALYACPITWIILGIIALIAVIYAVVAAINKFQNTSISATGIIAGVFATAAAFVANVFVMTINLIIDLIALLWNHIAVFAEFFANVLNDPIGSIVRLFAGMADTVLGILETIASSIDTIFGSHLADAVSGWRNSLEGAVTDLVGEAKIKIPRIDPKKLHLDRIAYKDAYNAGYKFGEKIESKFDISKILNPSDLAGQTDLSKFSFSPADTIADNTKKAADNTKAIADSLDITEEDLKYLRDLAEREVIDRTVLRDVHVNLSNSFGDIRETADIDGIVTEIERRMFEAIESGAEGDFNV
ncbi:tape measure protein [Defluviitalea raffinosedens]|uniref:Tape measure protein n=1 Tax=Defluviitalea raffinosedens TaxID=1450156 RepID=A0A7C8LC40_9FIRM|nr:tape measure protein [Defluviitalea raffinosedens]KAE9633712.1 tape measure protein [Defluviitalea raffinosedens]